MTDMTVKRLISFPVSGAVFPRRDHSGKLRFETDASQFPQLVHLLAFPDLAIIEATFVLKEVAGRAVAVRTKKEKV